MRHVLVAALCTLAMAGGGGQAQAAAYTFIPLDAPGAGLKGTTVTGINDLGQVVGYTSNYPSSFTANGFLYSGGAFTPVNQLADPAYNSTYPTGINNLGQITGYLEGPTGTGSYNQVSFVATNNVFAELPNPPSGAGSGPFIAAGISDSGTVVGTVTASLGYFPYVSGTIYSGGTLTSSFNFRTLVAINNSGELAGNSISTHGSIGGGAGSFGFVDVAGTILQISPPNAAIGSVTVSGLSNLREVVGSYYDSVRNGSFTGPEHGFVYDNGSYTTIDVPGASATVADGVNAAGDVVGYYTDATGQHGFLATPVAVPEPASATLLGMGLAALGIALRCRRKAA